MNDMNMNQSYAVGGGCMLGVGIGFFVFQYSVFAFVGSVVGGIGVGLLIAAFMKK